MSRRTALWLMVVALLAAAAIRFPDLLETPPGLHYDEAANGILAGDIGFRGEKPVFIPSYTGKEPLFFYLAGSLMRLLGETVYSLRLTAALIGLLTVAATFWLGTELLGSRRVALLAAALLAVSFWHVLFSRLGFRAISQPLLQALAVAALYHGLRRDSRWWLFLAGVAIGLSAYTYLAVRFFPIPLALALIPLLTRSRDRRRRLGQLALFFASGFVILLPLAIYFIGNPESFWVRAGQVLPGQSSVTALIESYWRSLGMLFIEGDPYWRFNIPGRPIFDWFLGAFFVVGLVLTIVRLARAKQPLERSAYLLLILVPLFMLLPTALAIEEIVPSNLRAIGLLPFVMYFPAIALDSGFDLLVRGTQSLFSRLKIDATKLSGQAANVAFVLLLLVVGSATIVRTYHQAWAARADLFYENDSDLAAVAGYLSEASFEDGPLYLAAQHYQHPTLAFLSDKYDSIKWLPGGEAIVFPAQGSATVIFPHNVPAPEWALPYLSTVAVSIGPAGPDGEPLYQAYRLPAVDEVGPANEVNLRFGDMVTLLGYELGSTDSGAVPVNLFWRVENTAPAGIQPFAHLEDEWGYRWGQVESFGYPSEQWAPGEIVIQRLEMPVAPGMHPGSYQLWTGFFNAENGQQLGAVNNLGHYVGSGLAITDIPVSNIPYPDPLPIPAYVLDLPAGPNLTLLGYERSGQQVESGADFGVDLWWNSDGPLEPGAVRLELVGEDNSGPIVQNGTFPVHGTYAFEDWDAPQFLIDHLQPRVTTNVRPGKYTLRLRLLNELDQTITTADLGPLIVEEANRLFTPPRTTHPTVAEFGHEIELLGYDLEPLDDSRFRLRLAWRGLTEPSDDYTVFVHVLRQDGSCCAWQQDVQPLQGAYPTSRWLEGEVVVDEYIIEMPADSPSGQYQIELGFYLPRNGLRLQVEVPEMRQRDVLYLTQPVVIE